MSPEETEAQRVAYRSHEASLAGASLPLRPRSRLVVSVGDLLEIIGLAALVVGVLVLFGVGWALLAFGGLAVGSAQLLFDGMQASVPLPRKGRLRTAANRALLRVHRLVRA